MLLLVVVACVHVAGAQAPLVLRPGEEVYDPTPHLVLLEDPTGTLTQAELADPALADRFEPVEERVPAFGYTTSTYWLRLPVVDQAPERRWLLEVYNKSLDDIAMYVPRPAGEGIEVYQAGDRRPFFERVVRHRNFVFPLDVPVGEVQTVHVRVASRGPVTIPTRIWSEQAFMQKERVSQLFLGAFFGVLLIMAAYNFFLYVAIGDRSYLYYVLYIVSYLAYQLSVERIGFEYVWPEQLWWQDRANSTLALITLIFATQFSRSFLHLRAYSVHMDRALIALMGLAGGVLVLQLVGPRPFVNQVVVAFYLTTLPIVFAAGLLCWRRGNRVARYYLLAWTCLLVGAAVVLLSLLDVLPYSFWSTRSLQVGSALEVTLLSLGLGYRYSAQQKARERMRLQIASDLHDDIGSGLTQISFYSELALRAEADGSAAGSADGWAERVGEEARKLMSNMQDIVWAVRPKQETWEALELRIRDFAADLFAGREVDFEMRGHVSHEHEALPPMLRRSVLLMVKEILHNCVRHAQCRHVVLRFRVTRRTLWLQICDDGDGFEMQAQHGGHGLHNLRYRAEQIDARLHIETAPGAGTCIEVEAPVHHLARGLPE